MKKKSTVEPVSRFKQYKYDIAMEQAAKRAESHPKPISMVSHVKAWVRLDNANNPNQS